jgi:hypothetical protein
MKHFKKFPMNVIPECLPYSEKPASKFPWSFLNWKVLISCFPVCATHTFSSHGNSESQDRLVMSTHETFKCLPKFCRIKKQNCDSNFMSAKISSSHFYPFTPTAFKLLLFKYNDTSQTDWCSAFSAVPQVALKSTNLHLRSKHSSIQLRLFTSNFKP